jgi:uncharacterized protein involved in response to NO
MTTTSAERYRAHRGPALFSMGFRPFFLFSAAWAALAVPIWVAAYAGLLPQHTFTRDWHVHEMLFGYLSGVIAGFLLTAVPNWTGRLPVTGAPLIALFALWAAGRIAMLAAPALGPVAAGIDTLFLFALAGVIAREILAGRNIRNAPVCVLISVLGIANVLWHLGEAYYELSLLAERIGLSVVAMLISIIGGRIVPSFTRNWMAKRALKPEPAPASRFDAAALAVTAAALLAWLIAPVSLPGGALFVAAGVINFVRLARWRGWTTSAEPLVLILHAGYAWLATAFTLLGLASLAPEIVPSAAGIHALTAGAFGVMTLAVMTRASLGHTGRPLAADGATRTIYLLVNLGAATRVAAPFFPDAYALALAASAIPWSAAFALFAAAYGPFLLRPRGVS